MLSDRMQLELPTTSPYPEDISTIVQIISPVETDSFFPGTIPTIDGSVLPTLSESLERVP